MRAQDKVEFLTNLLLKKQTKRSLEVKEALKEELSQHPYASVSIFVLINDNTAPTSITSTSYSMNANHLERCLERMDAAEYARFKYTKAVVSFIEESTKKINEYAS